MPRDTVAEIKNRLSIKDVVSPYVKLTKAGRSLKGLCPFHKEKTPSFVVSEERGTFHCFGCGVGGDAFSFIEKIEGVDFKGAMTLLAEKAGVEVVYDPKAREASSKTERLREAMSRAVEFYTEQLGEGRTEAYRYADSRGLTKGTIKEWQLGYSPNEWRRLLEHLSAKGFTVDELLACGLIKEADGRAGTYYDRFRHRLMFPIRDVAGRTVAFTGRALPGEESKQSEAKYLNSPETELYHKSQILFGMDRAKDAIRTRGFALLVEGQMDLLHAHQAGFANAIALSGTAFTPLHAKLLMRYSENLMLALDADSAGLAATQKTAIAALDAGMRVKVVRLPKDKDPADVIQEDPKDFTARIKNALPVVDFFLTVLAERERDSHRLILISEKVVLPLIRAMKSPMEQGHFVENTARALGLGADAVRAALAKVPQMKVEGSMEATPAPVAALDELAARTLMLQALIHAYPKTALADEVQTEYARITEAALPKESPPEAVVFEVEAAFGETPEKGAASDLLRAFEFAYVRKAHEEAVRALRLAEKGGGREAISRAEKAAANLGKRLAALST